MAERLSVFPFVALAVGVRMFLNFNFKTNNLIGADHYVGHIDTKFPSSNRLEGQLTCTHSHLLD